MLVSWALPKGVPTSKTENHLAVQTEDHPMDYADFEGTIPKGQYGAGTISIWDRGYYECEKWIAGKEVIATLTGQDDGGLGGVRRFALIHTGRGDDQWLIHLMDPPGTEEGRRRPRRRATEPARTRNPRRSPAPRRRAGSRAAPGPGGLPADAGELRYGRGPAGQGLAV